MNPLRLILFIIAGCCFLLPESARAQQVSPPFEMDKQYSAELMVMLKDGTTMRGKTYIDGDKMRSEMTTNGVDSVTIIRKDEQKMYVLLTAQKIAMSMPYDPDKVKGQSAATFGPEGVFERLGPEMTDGTNCMKYKVTSYKDHQVVFFWLDLDNKVPLRMEAEDKAYILKWRKYQTGPQNPSLFTVPSEYQVMPLPSMPGTGQ